MPCIYYGDSQFRVEQFYRDRSIDEREPVKNSHHKRLVFFKCTKSAKRPENICIERKYSHTKKEKNNKFPKIIEVPASAASSVKNPNAIMILSAKSAICKRCGYENRLPCNSGPRNVLLIAEKKSEAAIEIRTKCGPNFEKRSKNAWNFCPALLRRNMKLSPSKTNTDKTISIVI